jgi:hypothetical protein
MKRQILHDILSSFTLWFEHSLLDAGQAYTNNSGNFYYVTDDTFPTYTIFSAPFKQLVYDYSVSGAEVPSGIYVNNSFIPRSGSGLIIDYNNGRVLFPSGSGDPSWNVSGNYSVKEFNIYRTTRSDEELIFNNKYMFNPPFPQVATGIAAGSVVAPAIFLKLVNMSNDPFEIGGMNESIINIRAIILSDKDFTIDGVGNIFTDTKFDNFVIIPKTPLNEFGDTKGGYYNYNDWMTGYFAPNTIPYISDVNFSKLLTVGMRDIDPDLKVGFLDFQVKHPRFT